MRPIRVLLTVAILLPLAGCLEVDTRIAVNGDGSGTITERVVIKGAMAEMMKQMGDGSGGMVDQAKVTQRAQELGEGVSVVSATPLTPAEGVGAVAVFSFRDLNTVRLEQNPAQTVEAGDAGGGGKATVTQTPSPKMRFRFEPGPPAVITVLIEQPPPDEKPDASGSGDANTMPNEMLDGFKQMLEGMRFSTALSVDGAILETNASYRDGNTITLLDLELHKLLDADPDSAQKLAPGTDLATMKAALEKIPGMKLELGPEVRIVFAPGMSQAATGSPAAAPPAATTPARRAGGELAWRALDPAQLAQRRSDLVSVVDDQGVEHKGLVESASATAVTLRRARSDGGGTVTVTLQRVRSAQVLTTGD